MLICAALNNREPPPFPLLLLMLVLATQIASMEHCKTDMTSIMEVTEALIEDEYNTCLGD
jgi:hypothetical protein